jgi:hypothetical protein
MLRLQTFWVWRRHNEPSATATAYDLIPTVGCSEVDEFREGGKFSFALPNKPDISKDAKVRDRHLLYAGNLELAWYKRQAYSGGNKG